MLELPQTEKEEWFLALKLMFLEYKINPTPEQSEKGCNRMNLYTETILKTLGWDSESIQTVNEQIIQLCSDQQETDFYGLLTDDLARSGIEGEGEIPEANSCNFVNDSDKANVEEIPWQESANSFEF